MREIARKCRKDRWTSLWDLMLLNKVWQICKENSVYCSKSNREQTRLRTISWQNCELPKITTCRCRTLSKAYSLRVSLSSPKCETSSRRSWARTTQTRSRLRRKAPFFSTNWLESAKRARSRRDSYKGSITGSNSELLSLNRGFKCPSRTIRW